VVRDIALELLANGEIQHGWLGIKAISLTAQLVQSLELGEDKGLLVSEITDKALARKGLKAGTQEALLGAHEVFFGGDIIIDIEGEMVDSYASLLDALSAYRANDVVKVTVNRDGELQTLELGLVKRPSNAKEMIF
jgi:serine protease Do